MPDASAQKTPSICSSIPETTAPIHTHARTDGHGVDEDDSPHNKREGDDKKEWVVDDGACTDGGTVLGFSMRYNHSRTTIHAVSGT